MATSSSSSSVKRLAKLRGTCGASGGGGNPGGEVGWGGRRQSGGRRAGRRAGRREGRLLGSRLQETCGSKRLGAQEAGAAGDRPSQHACTPSSSAIRDGAPAARGPRSRGKPSCLACLRPLPLCRHPPGAPPHQYRCQTRHRHAQRAGHPPGRRPHWRAARASAPPPPPPQWAPPRPVGGWEAWRAGFGR